MRISSEVRQHRQFVRHMAWAAKVARTENQIVDIERRHEVFPVEVIPALIVFAGAAALSFVYLGYVIAHYGLW